MNMIYNVHALRRFYRTHLVDKSNSNCTWNAVIMTVSMSYIYIILISLASACLRDRDRHSLTPTTIADRLSPPPPPLI